MTQNMTIVDGASLVFFNLYKEYQLRRAFMLYIKNTNEDELKIRYMKPLH